MRARRAEARHCRMTAVQCPKDVKLEVQSWELIAVDKVVVEASSHGGALDARLRDDNTTVW